jgi:two-component system catabolic regulation response regulator CreB
MRAVAARSAAQHSRRRLDHQRHNETFSMKPRILVVEDEPGIADTIRYALASDGFEPLWCATGEAALAAIQTNTIALAILDVGLPDINGFDLFKRLQKIRDTPTVFLTARSDEIDRVVGLELGADDYILKPFSPRELVARVRTVLRRSQRATSAQVEASTSSASAIKPLELDLERRRIRYYGRALDLSRYEYGILATLIARPGRVFTRDELLAKVWDGDSDSYDRTVDAHVKTLRAKLKAVAADVEAIVTHRGTGYALAEDLPAEATLAGDAKR